MTEARLTAVVDLEAGDARLRIDYRLRPLDRTEVPLRALVVGESAVARVRAHRGSGHGAPTLAVRESPRRAPAGLYEAVVALPAQGEDGAARVSLSYEIEGGVVPTEAGWEVTLPVAAALMSVPEPFGRNASTSRSTRSACSFPLRGGR